ncbi:hypothetical protein [Bacillus cereus]
MKEDIDEVLDKEIIIVAGSGNTLVLTVYYPVKYENAINLSVL